MTLPHRKTRQQLFGKSVETFRQAGEEEEGKREVEKETQVLRVEFITRVVLPTPSSDNVAFCTQTFRRVISIALFNTWFMLLRFSRMFSLL